ncbi:folliculin isoform X2 [Toxorhynchites rutilus septentrionalis]|uniref:folliculin isoform X2 n=1 Tax=Toxorhynchites rutilus septentrionalis TaxID=329112 RepID=UPI00247A6931|nr:folliculin isoform X2 [Toxorhynchites rutilus septentrionalis]
MNAIIALCHFCEAHGPGALFCTQTLRETNIHQLDINFDSDRKGCPACNSIGNTIGLVSKDPDSNAHFVSSQVPVINETIELVKKAAFRSISSEVSSPPGSGSGDGGMVFFGDAQRGHVLSHTFHLVDSNARGFSKLFSIVVLMKDKTFLLNIQPFLADCLKKISKELQGYASVVHEQDLKAQGSQRAQRMSQGYTGATSTTRSLAELTGKESIFAYLHAHFSFVLWAGVRYLTESITLGSPSVPPWLGRDTEEGFTMVQTDKEGYMLRRMGLGKAEDESNQIDERTKAKYSLRMFRQILKSDFPSVCFCVLTGIQIVIRGPFVKGACLVRNLKKLIPEPLHKLVRARAESYKAANECRIINLSQDAVAPNPSAGIMRIDLVDDRNKDTVAVCVWEVPMLLQKITKAVDEELFTDLVLDKHLRALIEEWKNKVVCIRKMSSNQDVAKIKRIMGIQPQDQTLITYWYSHL